jgi:hypothetical protein
VGEGNGEENMGELANMENRRTHLLGLDIYDLV